MGLHNTLADFQDTWTDLRVDVTVGLEKGMPRILIYHKKDKLTVGIDNKKIFVYGCLHHDDATDLVGNEAKCLKAAIQLCEDILEAQTEPSNEK